MANNNRENQFLFYSRTKAILYLKGMLFGQTIDEDNPLPIQIEHYAIVFDANGIQCRMFMRKEIEAHTIFSTQLDCYGY